MSLSQGASQPVRIECAASPEFEAWLAQSGGSLAVTTYQAGKVAMIGFDGRQVTLLMREFDKPLGLAVSGRRLALATRHEVTIFADAPLLAHEYAEGQPGRYDALYLPRVSYHTGDVHAHDVAFEGDDLVIVNTRFSCLARVSLDFNFRPVWKPTFVSDLVPEDRCHLNGVAMVDGRAKYVTALGTTDAPGAWRENKARGGVLIDVETDGVLLGGLSMPHSPRWYGGRLWVLNSGTGELLTVDPVSGQATAVCGLQGYLRGLSFVGPFALVGLCKIREKHIFGGLPIQQKHAGAKLLCGVAIVDLRRGAQVGFFEFTSGCEELYDVQFLPGVRRPMILNLDKPAVRLAMTNPESSYWLRASAEVPLPSEQASATPSTTAAGGATADSRQNHASLPLAAATGHGGTLVEGNLIPGSGN